MPIGSRARVSSMWILAIVGTIVLSSLPTASAQTASVASIQCTPVTQTRPEGGVAEFQCTVLDSTGAPFENQQITADVTAGPNADEILPFNCGSTTDKNGQTPANGSGVCSYRDATANTLTSPPGVDTVIFCVQAAAAPGQPSTVGCDPHELQTQGNESASVTWTGNAHTISCTPDGATAPPSSSVEIVCATFDSNNSPGPAGVTIQLSENGAGTLSATSCATDAAGRCVVNLTSVAVNDLGSNTVTATMGGTSSNCQPPPNFGQPNPGTTADCSDTASVTFQTPVSEPPPPTCPQGIPPNDAGVCFFDSNISIAFDRNDDPPAVEGQVTNALRRCQGTRLVRLFVNGNRTDKTDVTDADGNYSIPKRVPRREQSIRTKVTSLTFVAGNGATVVCGASRSRSVDIRARRG